MMSWQMFTNKLSLNLQKSNFVFFRPYQKKVPFTTKLYVFDPSTNKHKHLVFREFVNHIDTIL